MESSELRLGWVRVGQQWKFTHDPLSIQAFAMTVVTLRAMARSAQLARKTCMLKMRGSSTSLQRGRLLFRGCSTIFVLRGTGSDVVLPDMIPYQRWGSSILCAKGSCRSGSLTVPTGHMAYVPPGELPEAISMLGDTIVVLILVDREFAMGDATVPAGARKLLAKCIVTAERVRHNEYHTAWRSGKRKLSVPRTHLARARRWLRQKSQPLLVCTHRGCGSSSPPVRRRVRKKYAPLSGSGHLGTPESAPLQPQGGDVRGRMISTRRLRRTEPPVGQAHVKSEICAPVGQAQVKREIKAETSRPIRVPFRTRFRTLHRVVAESEFVLLRRHILGLSASWSPSLLWASIQSFPHITNRFFGCAVPCPCHVQSRML